MIVKDGLAPCIVRPVANMELSMQDRQVVSVSRVSNKKYKYIVLTTKINSVTQGLYRYLSTIIGNTVGGSLTRKNRNGIGIFIITKSIETRSAIWVKVIRVVTRSMQTLW